jgi:hypothetical protein
MAAGKRLKEILAYAAAMLISGGVSYLIFPSMIKHIFKTGNGAASIENLQSSNFVSQLKIYFGMINNEVFGGYLLIILLVLVFMLILNLLYKNQDDEHACVFGKTEIQQYACLLVPSAFYVLLISKTAPFNTDRYVSPIYPILIIGVMGLVYKVIICYLHKQRNAIALLAVLIAVITVGGLSNCEWEYLCRANQERLNNAEIYGENASAICLYRSFCTWRTYKSYLEISKCETSVFYEATNYDEFIGQFDIEDYDGDIAFFLTDTDADSFIERFISDYPMYEVELNNGNWGYGESVYLKRLSE